MNNISIISQARINSTRLPNKIMREAGGKALLQYHTERLKSSGVNMVIATTDDGSEGPIVDFCDHFGISFYKGSESNVLERFYQTAVHYNLDTIIRVTSDCPLIDGAIIAKGLEEYKKTGSEYCYYSNALERNYPRGMDYEIFSFALLEDAYKNAQLQSDKEHVTPYIWNNRSGKVLIKHDENGSKSWNKYRITLDTAEDFALISELIEEFNAADLSCKEIVQVMENNPHLYEINKMIEQKKV